MSCNRNKNILYEKGLLQKCIVYSCGSPEFLIVFDKKKMKNVITADIFGILID